MAAASSATCLPEAAAALVRRCVKDAEVVEWFLAQPYVAPSDTERPSPPSYVPDVFNSYRCDPKYIASNVKACQDAIVRMMAAPEDTALQRIGNAITWTYDQTPSHTDDVVIDGIAVRKQRSAARGLFIGGRRFEAMRALCPDELIVPCDRPSYTGSRASVSQFDPLALGNHDRYAYCVFRCVGVMVGDTFVPLPK